MSVRVMTQVWEVDLPDSEKLVLLALADCANDEGGCWPSMKTLTAKCSKSDRTIQAAIKSLVAKGHLSRVEKPGKGCHYSVHPRCVEASELTPEAASPRSGFPPKGTTLTPEGNDVNPRSGFGQTVKNHQEPPKESEAKVSRPEGVSVQLWRDFLKLRNAKRAPLTESALKSILREVEKAGWTLPDALEECVARGWQAFKAEWVPKSPAAQRALEPVVGI